MRPRLPALWLLRSGRGVREVAQVVGVHERTVQRWVGWYRQGGLAALRAHRQAGRERAFLGPNGAPMKGAPYTSDYAALVHGYLWQSLETLIDQMRLIGDREWLRQQSLYSLAIQHGALCDRVLRMLTASFAEQGQPARLGEFSEDRASVAVPRASRRPSG